MEPGCETHSQAALSAPPTVSQAEYHGHFVPKVETDPLVKLPLCDVHPSTSGGFGPRPGRSSHVPLSEPPLSVSTTSTSSSDISTSNDSRSHKTSAATAASAVCQLSMPPPKKPKNGPTREEQFLSGEELRVLCESAASRSPTAKDEGRDEPAGEAVTRGASQSPEAAPSTSSPSLGSGLTAVPSSPLTPASDGPGLVTVNRATGGDGVRKVPLKAIRRTNSGSSQPAYSQHDRGAFSPDSDASGASVRLRRVGPSSTQSAADVEPGGGHAFSHPGASGRLIERLISERLPPDVGPGGSIRGSAFRGHQQRVAWPPRGLPTSPIGQPHVYSPDPRNPSLGYRLTTSTSFASLVNQQPPWLAFDQAAPGLRPSVGSLDIQGLQSAASFTVQQQQHQHHQQLTQQQRRQSILTSLFSSNISGELTSPPSGDDVFLHRSSSPGGLRPSISSSSSSYLSSVMRHASQAGLRASAALANAVVPRSGGESGPAQRTESAPVYLHPAFQLPPSPTSNIRKNHSTSTLAPRASSPPSPGPPQPLPRHCNNAITAATASPLRQTKTGHELVLQALRGSSGNLISPTDTTLSSNGNGINNNNKNNHNINNNSKNSGHHFRSVSDLNSGANNNNISSSAASVGYYCRAHDDGSTLLDLSLKGPSGRLTDEETGVMSRSRGSLSRASMGSHGSSCSPPLPPPPGTLSSPTRQSPPVRHGSVSSSPTRNTPRLGSLGTIINNINNSSSSSPPPLHYHGSLGRASPPSRQGSLDSSSPHTPRRGSLGHNSPLSRQSSTSAPSPPPPPRKPSSLLTTLMEAAPSEIPRAAGRAAAGSNYSAASARASPANSDDSNSYINVTSPVAPSSLLRAPSGSDSSSPPLASSKTAPPLSSSTSPPSPHVTASPQQPQSHRTSELAGLLTQPPSTSTSFTSFSSSSTLASALLAVKKEVGASSASSPSALPVPYALITCKTEARRSSQDTDSRYVIREASWRSEKSFLFVIKARASRPVHMRPGQAGGETESSLGIRQGDKSAVPGQHLVTSGAD
ncbi:hypothetical protein EGW08_004933 [Elysia chlorotica]|uniref:Uncharacterized protein n=1 Tax=Elysia chlorotica TaxID=188477 RepID=A0A433U0F0_ELYCH|nr:hypothetical protein EGW08_004933 [Elysia chlorotica]